MEVFKRKDGKSSMRLSLGRLSIPGESVQNGFPVTDRLFSLFSTSKFTAIESSCILKEHFGHATDCEGDGDRLVEQI